jgi:hypothetical protein
MSWPLASVLRLHTLMQCMMQAACVGGVCIAIARYIHVVFALHNACNGACIACVLARSAGSVGPHFSDVQPQRSGGVALPAVSRAVTLYVWTSISDGNARYHCLIWLQIPNHMRRHIKHPYNSIKHRMKNLWHVTSFACSFARPQHVFAAVGSRCCRPDGAASAQLAPGSPVCVHLLGCTR